MSYEYKVNGQTVSLPVNEDMVAVRYKDELPKSRRASVAADTHAGVFSQRVEIPGEKYTLLPVAPTPEARKDRWNRAQAAMEAHDDVVRVAPVFKLGGDKMAVATDKLLIGYERTAVDLQALVDSISGQILEQEESHALVQLPPAADPFALAKEVSDMPGIRYAEPDFVTLGKHLAQAPGTPLNVGPENPLMPKQYALRLTQAEAAWALQKGSPNIRIAILDEGVDTQHKDLRRAIVGSFDSIDNDTYQEPNSWDGHGTACAGLAAAEDNDIGIRGMAAGCALLAVRIAYSKAPQSGWSTSNSIIGRGIDWAWKQGKADVLSNSWGGGTPSNYINEAFQNAITQGRDGKGCVIVIAAGNAAADVQYPANLANVLAVAASNEYDQPKTKASADGEYWWGSCYGPEVSVSAPGVHNYTTDISGVSGYNPGGILDSDYVATFNGTSSATPLVAGVAALVLSANPNLNQVEARAIICETADKVGDLPYYNGRNDHMGFGRINAYKAVQEALASHQAKA